jgi:prepilin-type N-terminal cleavage/methylation domain-containing protein
VNHSIRGFTLIEIMVAMAILTVLSIYSARSIQRAIKTKVKIEKEISRTSVVREALRVIERDVNLAFNYRDINIDLFNAAGKERQTASASPTPSPSSSYNPTTGQTTPVATQQAPQPQTSFKPRQQQILTQFLGSEKELTFTTLSNVRTMADVQESDQIVVGYTVHECSNWINKNLKSNCLWRRVNPIISDDITKGGEETVLLENVTRFELRYLGPGKNNEWQKQWYTDSHGDDTTKGIFPYAVEITIETQNKNIEGDKPLAMTWVAALRFPNNPAPSNSASAGLNGTQPVQGAVPQAPPVGPNGLLPGQLPTR